MVTEIGARDLGDPSRYNLLEVSVHLTCLQRKKVDKKMKCLFLIISARSQEDGSGYKE